ncbi:hypothetical protein FPQ18DRAFT_306023 [Pyronema domesticum]|nr:hypothetical protein FPQ18DRAFT_306023 [Pyronema domesticum]
MNKEELPDISLAEMFRRGRRKSEVKFNKLVDLRKIYNYSRTSDNNDEISNNSDETSNIQLSLRSKHKQRRRLRILLYSSVAKYTLRRLVRMKKRKMSVKKLKQLEEMFPRFGWHDWEDGLELARVWRQIPIIYKKRKVNRESTEDKKRVSVSIEETGESDGSGSSDCDEESQSDGESEGREESERAETSEGDGVSERDEVTEGTEESDRDEKDKVVKKSKRNEEMLIEGDAPRSANTEKPDEEQVAGKYDHEKNDGDTLEGALGALTITDQRRTENLSGMAKYHSLAGLPRMMDTPEAWGWVQNSVKLMFAKF